MTPYYDQDGITIYHADCREVLPTLEPVDLVLTDPPYGIGENVKRQRARQGHGLANQRNYGHYNWDCKPPPWLVELIISLGKYAIVWGGNYFELEPSSCWLVWDKDNGATDFADCELAWTNLKKAVRRIRWRWQGMLQETMGSHKEPRFHPTQKPLAVMKWAIAQAPEDCQLILDPFMGSGTTLRAAKDLGRKAIGIEIEERYCEIAARRLEQGVLNFEPEASS
jgi:DNA modification methylase